MTCPYCGVEIEAATDPKCMPAGNCLCPDCEEIREAVDPADHDELDAWMRVRRKIGKLRAPTEVP